MSIQQILKTAFFTPGPKGTWGLPLLAEGSPGTGKTSITEDVTTQFQLPLETIIASLREPSDFLGLPVPTVAANGGTVLSYLPPTWAQRLAENGRGVAFLDELSTAAPSVQNALLRVVLDRYVGDLHLPNIRFIAAMNRVDETAGGYELATALANRFIHLAWEAPSLQEWQAYLMGGGDSEADILDPDAEENRVLGLWDPAFAKARGMLAGYVQKAPHMIHVQPKAHDPAASKAWPSRRSWEMVARVIAGADVHNLNAVDTQTLLAGCVGTAAMADYCAYQENSDMPDPVALLDGKVQWEPDNRLDRTLATLAACTALVSSPQAEHRNERASALWDLMSIVGDKTADLVIPHATVLVKAQLGQLPAARKTMLSIGHVMKAAGLIR